MPPSFYAQQSLHVEIYDTMTSTGWDEAGADVSFLCERFRNIQGPILELACGSGRVAIPLAEAGYEVHGLDASSAMLSIAEAKRRDLPNIAASRLFLTEGDMREFAFAIQFGELLWAWVCFSLPSRSICESHTGEPSEQR
jgi:ubiquinone/menaquinone biosynthesis C-methylase UbiE